MAATNGTQVGRAVTGGAAAGLIGGVVIAFFLFVMAVVQGLDVWTVFKAASAPFYGDEAFEPGLDAGPVLMGTLLHFAIALAWGVLFGVLAYGLSNPMTVLAGALYGLIVWLGMYYVVLPLVGLGEMVRTATTSTTIIAHILFGIAVGAAFVPFQQRKVVAEPRRPAEVPS
jgi:hypothetical protein